MTYIGGDFVFSIDQAGDKCGLLRALDGLDA
jgi:hypothetical protein